MAHDIVLPRRIGLASVTDPGRMDQDAHRLQQSGCAEIWSSAILDAKRSADSLRAGDTLVVTGLDVLGPPLAAAVLRVRELLGNGISFMALDEDLHLTPALGDAQAAVFQALGRCVDVWERQRAEARRRTLRSRNGRAGRHSRLTADDRGRVRALLDAPGARMTDVARALGVGRTTLYRFLHGME